MKNVLSVDGNKIWVELEWEQIDSIVRNEIRDHVYMLHREMTLADYLHPDDKEHNKILLPALLTVYEYWAGQEEAKKIKEHLDADNQTIRSAE